MKKYENKKIAILGLGMEGQALANFLISEVQSIDIIEQKEQSQILADLEVSDRAELENILNNPKVNFKHSEELPSLLEYELIFRSPSIYFAHPKILEAKKAGVTVSSQIQLFFDLCPCRIIGVTGTKGKGTTASLIFSMLNLHVKGNVYLAGNIGTPAITMVPNLKNDDIVILELSNFQLADLTKSPEIAVVTNLEVDHLDYHKDKAEYQLTKTNIVQFQNEDGIAILNKESSFDTDFIDKIKSKVLYFSTTNQTDAFVEDDRVFLNKNNEMKKVCSAGEIKLVGTHNLANIAAASLVAAELQIELPIISRAVKEFQGLPHRLEFVRELNNIKFINDSFATNPGPTIAAVKAFKETKILILGGSEKGADFSEMAEVISESNTKAVVTIGVESGRIISALKRSNFSGQILEGGNSIDEIIYQAFSIASPGDIIVFSPACASFDMFKNYKERGEQFKNSVFKLESKSK